MEGDSPNLVANGEDAPQAVIRLETSATTTSRKLWHRGSTRSRTSSADRLSDELSQGDGRASKGLFAVMEDVHATRRLVSRK